MDTKTIPHTGGMARTAFPPSTIAALATLWAGTILSCGDGGSNESKQSGGEVVPGGEACVVSATTPVAWTAATAWGSPEELFAKFAGTCQAPFVWDASGWTRTVAIRPLMGSDTLSATVEIDTNSARWKDRTAKPGASEWHPPCGGVLEVDATVSLALPSGPVAIAQKITLAASSAQAPTLATLTLPEAQFGTWVSFQKVSLNSVLGMQIQLSPVGDACAGVVHLTAEQRSGNMGSGSIGRLATWSASGCPAGTKAVPLDVPYLGVDLRDAVAQAFAQAAIPGRWVSGEATHLNLSAVPNGVACSEWFAGAEVVTIPVDVRADTTDSRIANLAGSGSIRATVDAAGLSQLQLNFSYTELCASTAATLAYTPVECAATERIQSQLTINRYYPDGMSNSGSLFIYQYLRGADPSRGAGQVEMLTLTP